MRGKSAKTAKAELSVLARELQNQRTAKGDEPLEILADQAAFHTGGSLTGGSRQLLARVTIRMPKVKKPIDLTASVDVVGQLTWETHYTAIQRAAASILERLAGYEALVESRP